MAGVSQEDAAQHVGVTAGTVSRWERGVQRISPEQEAALYQLYHRSNPAATRKTTQPAPRFVREEAAPYTGQLWHGRRRLPPRAYERVHGYLERMRAKQLPEEMVDEAERVMVDPLYSKLNKRDLRERSEEDLITDIDAAWLVVKEIVQREWGIKL